MAGFKNMLNSYRQLQQNSKVTAPAEDKPKEVAKKVDEVPVEEIKVEVPQTFTFEPAPSATTVSDFFGFDEEFRPKKKKKAL